MAGSIADFFDQLSRREHHEWLERIAGTIRFDLVSAGGTEHWLLAISGGKIGVSHDERDADCIVRTNWDLFDRGIRGERNLTAAWLCGSLTVDGRLELFRSFERLLPGPPTAHDPRDLVSGAKKRYR